LPIAHSSHRVSSAPPAVLVFAGHDPGGGAGIQADIEGSPGICVTA